MGVVEKGFTDGNEANVRALYSIMTSIENNIGGGEGIEGLYGSIRGADMQRILACMTSLCGLDLESHLLDVGAGLGRPLMHALLTQGIAKATGIEIDPVKCTKADAFLRQTLQRFSARTSTTKIPTTLDKLPHIICKPIQDVQSLDTLGITHLYSFWEGIPADARAQLGALVASSPNIRGIAVVQRSMRSDDPEDLMANDYDFGPGLKLEASFPVSMSGSGRRFTAYIFSRCLERIGTKLEMENHVYAKHYADPVVIVGTPPLLPKRSTRLRNLRKSRYCPITRKIHDGL